MNSREIHILLARLADCTATPGRGVTRFSYSQEDRLARDIVRDELALAGLEPWTDWAGNIHALLPGANPGLPAVMIGSHLDSVRNGGQYDGAVGVAGALTVLRRLAAAPERLARGVWFVAFAEEEGSNFNIPLLGSKAFIGAIRRQDLIAVTTPGGTGAVELMADSLKNEETPPEWADVKNVGHMLELHVEQGPFLDEEGVDIGVVEKIVADMVLTVDVRGVSGHSGAAAMRGRRDALAGAAEMIVACETIANSPDSLGAVATVGSLDCRPNAFNCIAEAVRFTVDVRHPDPGMLAEAAETVAGRLERIAAARSLEIGISRQWTEGVRLDPEVRRAVGNAADALGFSRRDIPSRAMHDAGAMAGAVKAGMIFIPSRNGLSHNPGEFTEAEAIEKGVETLFRAVAEIAAAP